MERAKCEQFRWAMLLALLPIIVVAEQARADQPGINPDLLDRGAFNSDGFTLDATFVLGKSIYLGRNRKLRGLRVCLSVPGEGDEAPAAVRLSRKVLKQFVGARLIVFTTRLVDCREPTSQVALMLGRKDFRALVYYMNKRFRLRLET